MRLPSLGKLRASHALEVAALLPFAVICMLHADSVPMWDARIYADCIDGAARMMPFRRLACADHPTHGYVLFTSLLSRAVPGRFWPILAMNVVLGLLGLRAFRSIAQQLAPELRTDALLMTAAFGVFPVLLAGTVSPNPDLGVAAFFLVLIDALLRQRRAAAFLAGLFLVFSKEPGVVLLALAAAVHGAMFVARSPGELRDKLRRLGWYAPLLVPVALIAWWFHYEASRRGGVMWGGTSVSGLLPTFTTFSLTDAKFQAQLVLVGVLQFSWILLLLAALRWLQRLGRFAFALPSPDPAPVRYVDWVFLGAAFLLTRYSTFLNARYYLPLYALLALCAYATVSRMSAAPRRATLLAIAGAFALSAFRTVDPISLALVPTFPFGEHRILAVADLGDACCGRGRDQLAYNLQHLQLHYLQDDIFAGVRPSASRAIAGHEEVDWLSVGRLDPTTRQRTMDRAAVGQTLLGASEIERGTRPEQLFFIRYPNFENAASEARIARFYEAVHEQRFRRGGYWIDVVEMRPRAQTSAR
jgi:hypothetical protein